MKRHLLNGALVFAVLAVAGGFLALIYGPNPQVDGQAPHAPVRIKPQPASWQPVFSPPGLSEAPAELRETVLLGYRIMMNTPDNAKAYVGQRNQLSCRNCHFEGGRTRGSVSLVGVGARYVPFAEGTKPSLAGKVQACFRTSLDGEPPPLGSRELLGVVTYLEWISQGVPLLEPVPWLGLAPLEAAQPASEGTGMQQFSTSCTPCHANTGQGTSIAPPLWGPGSFTTSSPILGEGKLARFIYANMPLGRPNLPPGTAVAVADFVQSQPRPVAPPPPVAQSQPSPQQAAIPQLRPASVWAER